MIEKQEKQYECLACKEKYYGKKRNCPNCGQKQYYCTFEGCDKQLDNPKHHYCSEHALEMKKLDKKVTPIAIGVAIFVFILAPACVLILVLSKGKVNLFKVALNLIGIKI